MGILSDEPNAKSSVHALKELETSIGYQCRRCQMSLPGKKDNLGPLNNNRNEALKKLHALV